MHPLSKPFIKKHTSHDKKTFGSTRSEDTMISSIKNTKNVDFYDVYSKTIRYNENTTSDFLS